MLWDSLISGTFLINWNSAGKPQYVSWSKLLSNVLQVCFKKNMIGEWVLIKNLWPGSGWVNFLWLGLGQPFMVVAWIWKISPKNVHFFNFFPFGSKKSLLVWSKSAQVKGGLASYLLSVKSKLGSVQSPSLVMIVNANQGNTKTNNNVVCL